MNSGKRYNYLKLAAQLEGIFDEPFFETVAVCSTSGEFDKTMKTFRAAITKSNLIAVKDTDIMDFIDTYINKIMLYNTLMRFINNDFKRPDEDMERIISENRLFKKDKLIEYII